MRKVWIISMYPDRKFAVCSSRTTFPDFLKHNTLKTFLLQCEMFELFVSRFKCILSSHFSERWNEWGRWECRMENDVFMVFYTQIM